MKTIDQLKAEVATLIATIEARYSRAELYGDCSLKSLYLELRATAYQLKNSPEAFGV